MLPSLSIWKNLQIQIIVFSLIHKYLQTMPKSAKLNSTTKLFAYKHTGTKKSGMTPGSEQYRIQIHKNFMPISNISLIQSQQRISYWAMRFNNGMTSPKRSGKKSKKKSKKKSTKKSKKKSKKKGRKHALVIEDTQTGILYSTMAMEKKSMYDKNQLELLREDVTLHSEGIDQFGVQDLEVC